MVSDASWWPTGSVFLPMLLPVPLPRVFGTGGSVAAGVFSAGRRLTTGTDIAILFVRGIVVPMEPDGHKAITSGSNH